MDTPPQALARTGARRQSDIPDDLLAALNAGVAPTANLVEWLAVDMATLYEASLRGLGLGVDAGERERARSLIEQPITSAMGGFGVLLYERASRSNAPNELFERLALHPSDVVRGWAAFMVAAAPSLALRQRLALVRRFAADGHALVREHAWCAVRPAVAGSLTAAIDLLGSWVRDEDPRLRRFAVEVTRPRGVWCRHIETLKADPEPALVLLEPVSADPSRYVQDSVANWLNDASKTRPDWVADVRVRWATFSPCAATRRILDRATRTLARTRGDEGAPVARPRRPLAPGPFSKPPAVR